jgi:N-acetylmuramoyl-L-alanine amidase
MLGLVGLAFLAARPTFRAQPNSNTYTIFTPEGRRQLPFRVVNGADVVSLDQLAMFFGLTITEDAGVGGLTLHGRGQPILLIPGQSFASIGPGKIVSLSAAIQRDRNAWQVPIDFVRQALGPALSLRVEVRRSSRIVLVGDVRVPQINGRFERQAGGVRLTLEAQPTTPHRVTREGNRLLVRYDAAALDTTPISGAVAEFATGARFEGTTVVVELGPQTASFRADDADGTRLVIDLLPLAPAAAPSAPPAPTPAPVPARPELAEAAPPEGVPTGSIRTIVIDPGHGGDDVGTQGARGTVEKDYVLQLARRVRAGIEGRFGLRVLLTRDSDENTPLDRRTSLANNNKAELFISLHANAAVRPAVRGAQVISLSPEDYRAAGGETGPPELPVPVVGGGTRRIDIVPWDLAQMAFADKSASVAAMLVRQLAERGVPLQPSPAVRMPLRVLVGANMPAVLLEVGFLSNPEDEAALAGPDRSTAIVEAIIAAIAEARRGIPTSPDRRP